MSGGIFTEDKTMNDVSEGQDIIDSRDIIARLEELKDEREGLQAIIDEDDEQKSQLDMMNGNERRAAEADVSDWDNENADELKALTDLQDECEGYSDWTYGEALIADDYFATYAQDLAEDIGAVQRDATWPNMHIDWDAASDALKQDYSLVTFGDTDYWIRA